MDQKMKAVAEAGDIAALYKLIRECPKVLEDIDHIPFVDTPLHIAASAGHTHFAVEMISLMPSFGRKLNPDGLSPLHLALQNEQTKTVIRLINIDSELIRVQGKERKTPLHYVAAEKNHVNLLAEFLCACPASVQDLTVGGETSVHIAVKNNNFDALEVLFGWAEKTDNKKVLQWKDEDGNTALDIAAPTTQPQWAQQPTVMEMLIKHGKLLCHKANKEIRNMLIGRAEASKSTSDHLADYMRSKRIYKFLNMKKMSNDIRNVLLLVATLVATATYQVTVNPPSGILAGPQIYYYSFLLINSSAFAASVSVIFLTIQISYYFVPLLHLCLYFLMYSFGISACFATPHTCTLASRITIAAPFIFFLGAIYCSHFQFLLQVFILKQMPIGKYNPSRFFEMQRQVVGG